MNVLCALLSSHFDDKHGNVLLLGEPLYIREVAKEARSDRRLWGSPPKIAVDMIDDESSFACVTDAVSGKMIVLRDLFLIDSYDEAYLCAVGLDFKSMPCILLAQ